MPWPSRETQLKIFSPKKTLKPRRKALDIAFLVEDNLGTPREIFVHEDYDALPNEVQFTKYMVEAGEASVRRHLSNYNSMVPLPKSTPLGRRGLYNQNQTQRIFYIKVLHKI